MDELRSSILKGQGVPMILKHGLQHPGTVAIVLKVRLRKKSKGIQLWRKKNKLKILKNVKLNLKIVERISKFN